MSISTIIKSIQDIMRKDAGVDGDAQRLSQLSWLLFLKIFDAQEEEIEFETENYKSPIPDNTSGVIGLQTKKAWRAMPYSTLLTTS